MSVWVNALVNLIEDDLCGVGIVDVPQLFGKDLFAPGREINVKVDASVDDARGRGGGKLWKHDSGKEKIWTRCD